MRRRRDSKHPDSPDQSFRELDALVLAELEALERSGRRRRREGPSRRLREEAEAEAPDNVIFRERWSGPRSRRHGRPAEDTAESLTSEPGPPDPVPSEPEMALDFDQAPMAGDTELFEPEEQAFITRTADWLRLRDNKDLIMSRIWTLLTEAEPSSFYTTGEDAGEAADSQEDGDNVEAPERQTDQDRPPE